MRSSSIYTFIYASQWTFVCAICLSTTFVLAGGIVTLESYQDDFDGGPVLPWLVFNDFGGGVFHVTPGSGGSMLDGYRLQSPALPILMDEFSNRELSISFSIENSNLQFEDGDVFVTLRPQGNYNQKLDSLAKFPLNPSDEGFFSNTVSYHTSIPISSIPAPLLGCDCSGLLMELSMENQQNVVLRDINIDWSRDIPTSTLNWDFGGGSDGLPSDWSQQTFAGSWDSNGNTARAKPDTSVAPFPGPNNTPEIRIDTTTPAFRFTDISNAVYEVDLAFSIQGNPNTDRVVFDLIATDTEASVPLGILDLVDINGVTNRADGVFRVNIVKDVFGGSTPPNHVDNETTYKIRTRVWDQDDEKDTIEYVDFDRAILTHAVLQQPADFTRDDSVSGLDFLLWQHDFSIRDENADFDGNEELDLDDLAIWRDFYGTVSNSIAVPGNADGDIDSDGRDFIVWQRRASITSTLYGIRADGNGDRMVDEADLSIWQSAYGTLAPLQSAAIRVPSPSAVQLIAFSLITLLFLERPLKSQLR